MPQSEKVAASPSLAAELARVAERLRRSTVQVHGHGPEGGSGVIWSSDGLIITNAHVARGHLAGIRLPDGMRLPAEVVWRDPQRDLAALRVKARQLEAAEIGDSRVLRPGELVLAVGNPFGLVGAVSTGIVHSVGPVSFLERAPYGRHWVQADVRLAPGNSGGPLANARGRVIGINSMIAGGLALAVPSHEVTSLLGERPERPRLGITTQPVTLSLGYRQVLGMLVVEVTPGSAAEGGGLELGDVLLKADGRFFQVPGDLAEAIASAGAENAIGFDLLRGGRHMACNVILRGPERGAEAA